MMMLIMTMTLLSVLNHQCLILPITVLTAYGGVQREREGIRILELALPCQLVAGRVGSWVRAAQYRVHYDNMILFVVYNDNDGRDQGVS